MRADDVDKTDFYGYTALIRAAKFGHKQCLLVSILTGANVNARNKNDNTGLNLAAQNGHNECVKLLIDAGAD